MNIEEVLITEPYELSPHHHAFINPYNGCSMGCPFCYWLLQEGWENRIQVRTNIAEILEGELGHWNSEEALYLGSICDPYNELEEVYGLSRRCLEVIQKKNIPLVITTSCIRETIFRDLNLLKKMKVIIVVELARIPMIDRMNRGETHLGIENANRLREEGLEVYATLAPICPGMMELQPVLGRLADDIPVYIDCLRCEPGGILAERTKDWIKKADPELLPDYVAILDEHDWSYYDHYLEKYRNNKRVKEFPFDLSPLK